MEVIRRSLATAIHPIADQFDKGSRPVFVTNGDGVVGYRVATRLLRTGYGSIRVGYRDPLDKLHHDGPPLRDLEMAAIDRLESLGATKADFCWDREELYENALEGVKTVFCTTSREGCEDMFPAFLEACRASGVRNVVKLSFFPALTADFWDSVSSDAAHTSACKSKGAFKSNSLVKMQQVCDRSLMKSGLNYTILFPSHFMSNPLRYQSLSLRNEKKFYGASKCDKGVNYVSPNDVADIAVRAILAPKDHCGKCYTLTGPERITDKDISEHLTKAFGEPIKYVEASLDQFLDTDLASLEYIKASISAEQDTTFLSYDIEKLRGREAETYEEYLLDRDSMSLKEQVTFLPA